MKTAKRAAKAGPGKKAIAVEAAEPLVEAVGEAPLVVDVAAFRAGLRAWFAEHARVLPWRGVGDPYAIWLSEIMLQQTRVATVLERYTEFLRKFPTLGALAAAREDEVLAVWSGLGYYRRARMFHKAAQFVVSELAGTMPGTSTELRTLPGIGEYTSAAIASIAYGESVAVVDGNVERVLLRVTGRAEEKTAAGRAKVAELAQRLVPRASSARKAQSGENAAGDHNQAMMELGATICLPRGPLCLQCPVLAQCRTRGEHTTLARKAAKVRRVAHLFALREVGGRTEVLLEQRAASASLMAGMFELPPLPLDAVTARPPVLRVRHGITDTNYQVEVFADDALPETEERRARLREAVPARAEDLHWVSAKRLGMLPLTGLARKCLLRLGVMEL